MKRLAPIARGLVAALVLAALLSSAIVDAQNGVLARHVSYFTVQSNWFFVIVIVAGLVLAARRPPLFDDLRGAVAFFLAMTGIIYALLVAPLDELLRWDIPWTGIVMHRLAPVAAIADWLLSPRRRAPSARRILWWQLFPVAFLAFTWVRGGITGWYPYAFLDPTASSWGQVLLVTVVVLVAFLAIATFVHALEGRLRPREVPATEPQPALP